MTGRWVPGDIVGLHWGCGPQVAEGWVNSDRDPHPGQEHTGDLLAGLPFADRSFRCVVTHHALQMLDLVDVIPALLELRRVTRIGGWIRVSVPDIELAVGAVQLGRHPGPETFLDRLFPDEATPGGALNRYLTHYGQRTYWTVDALPAVLEAAGWEVIRSPFGASSLKVGETLSGVERIAELDGRSDESLILEAVRR